MVIIKHIGAIVIGVVVGIVCALIAKKLGADKFTIGLVMGIGLSFSQNVYYSYLKEFHKW